LLSGGGRAGSAAQEGWQRQPGDAEPADAQELASRDSVAQPTAGPEQAEHGVAPVAHANLPSWIAGAAASVHRFRGQCVCRGAALRPAEVLLYPKSDPE